MVPDRRRRARELLTCLVAVFLVVPAGLAVGGGSVAADDGATADVPEAAALTDREAVAYVRMVDELRAYLRESTHYVGTDREAALYHAGHPIQCYWPFMEPLVRHEDPALADRLESEFESLPAEAAGRRGAAAYTRGITQSTFPLMAEAETAVVGEERLSDPEFNARVVRRLLSWTVYKYRKAHNDDGNIVLMGQFQDAHQLPIRAEKRFDEHVRPTLDEAEAERIDALFARLQSTIPDTNDQTVETAPAATVERRVDALNRNITAAVGLAPVHREPSSVAAERARAHLDAASEAYAAGQPNAAGRIIAGTYLANVQWLLGGELGYPDRKDTPPLVTAIERNFTYRLPGLIARDAPPEAFRENVSVARGQLERAGAIRERAYTPAATPTATPTATPSPTPTTARGTIERVAAPGVGLPLAAAALLAVALFVYRRRR